MSPRYNHAMALRVIALVLSFVLLWSGLTTVEPPRLSASAAPAGVLADAATPPSPLAGSVEHHHLDDLPSQALGEQPAESPVLLPSMPAPAVQVAATVRRLPASGLPWASPCLAGLLRPPCIGPVRG